MLLKSSCHVLSLIAAASLLAGCAHTYSIKSEPSGAMVYVNGEAKGQTPVSIPYGQLPSGGLVMVSVTREQYEPFEIALPSPTYVQLSSSLQVTLKRKPGEDTSKVNRQVSRFVRAQKLTMDKRYDDAMALVDEILAETPQLVYAQVLKGSILLLSGNEAAAQEQWHRVLQIDPANVEAQQMLKSTGGDTSAAVVNEPAATPVREPAAAKP